MDSFFNQSAVRLKLFFTRPPHANAHFQSGKVRPHSLESWQRVFKLSQFNCQAGFIGLGMRCENIKNQLGAVEHFDVKCYF